MKFSYWDTLPHLCLGMFPNDASSVDIAKQVMQEKAKMQEGKPMHRLTWRWLFDPGSHFGEMVATLAEGGPMDPKLYAELQEANMVATTEQRVE